MSRWNLSLLLGMFAITLVGLSLSYSSPAGVTTTLQKKQENLKLVVDVLEEVDRRYVRPLDDDKRRELVENMINSGLERLDPHSSFINADEYKQFTKQSRGKFGGIGIRIGIDRNGQILVESPMVGTPAYEAGIMAGDVIVKIDGKTTENMSLKKVVEMIQGDPGDKVQLSVLHEGAKKAIDIDIVRAEINIDSVLGDAPRPESPEKWDYVVDKDFKIAYVRITSFTETTVQELIKLTEHLQKLKMRGLVLDLRNNPGGLLKSAVEVSSMFLPEGKRVVSTKGRDKREENYDAHPPRGFTAPEQPSYPVTILLNRFSASASEIVAAALQDHLRAVIVGERSYGKGSVQNIIQMEGGASALKLTTASYWRPSQKNIHRFPDAKEEDEWGVKPDKGFEVKLTDEERIEYYKYRRDRDVVRKAGQPAPKQDEKDMDKDKKKEPFRDRVLDKALEHIRGELKKQAQAPAPPAHEARLPLNPRLGLPLPLLRLLPSNITAEDLAPGLLRQHHFIVPRDGAWRAIA